MSSTVVGPARPEPEIRRELARIYDASTDGWELLRVDEVRGALPAFPAGRPLRSPVALGEGLFVAGDHRDTPSQQGALVSGRRAAQAVLDPPARLTAPSAPTSHPLCALRTPSTGCEVVERVRSRAQNVLAMSRARASAAASSAARSPVSVGWKRISLTSVRPVQRSQSSK